MCVQASKKKKEKKVTSKAENVESAECRLQSSIAAPELRLPEDKTENASRSKPNKRRLETMRNLRVLRNNGKATMEKNKKPFHCKGPNCGSTNVTHRYKPKWDELVESSDDSMKAKRSKNPARQLAHGTSWRRISHSQAPSNILPEDQAFCNLGELPLLYYLVDIPCKSGLATSPSYSRYNELLQSQLVLFGSECCDTARAFVSSMTPKLQEYRKKKASSIVRSNRQHTELYLSKIQRKQVAAVPSFTSALQVRGIKVGNIEFGIVFHQSAREEENDLETRSKSSNRIIKYHSFIDLQGTMEKIVPVTLIELSCIQPFCNSTVYVGLKANFREEDDPVLRYLPYFGDHDSGDAIDVAQYQSVRSSSINTLSSIEDEVHEVLFRLVVEKWGTSGIVLDLMEKELGWTETKTKLHALQGWSEMPTKAIEGRIVEANRNLLGNEYPNRCRNGKVTSLAKRLAASPPFGCVNNQIGTPFRKAIAHGTKAPSKRSGSFRDLFCRMCYKYDCSVHGIQHPLPCDRNDPYYPKPKLSDDLRNGGICLSARDLAKEHAVKKFRPENSSHPTSEDSATLKSAKAPVARRSYRTHTRVNTMATNHLLQQEVCQSLKASITRSAGARKQESEMEHTEYVDSSCLSISRQDCNLMTSHEICSPFCFKNAEKSKGKHRKLLDFDNIQSKSIYTSVQLSLMNKIRSVFGDNSCIVARILCHTRCFEVAAFFEVDKKNKKNVILDDSNSLINARSKSGGKRRYNRRVSVGFHRNSLLRGRTLGTDQALEYEPCGHSGSCTAETCSCLNRGHTCEKACSCSKNCPNRFQGCRCSLGNCRTKACPCFAAARECLPDLCFTCGATEVPLLAVQGIKEMKEASPGKSTCFNVNLQLGVSKKIGVGFSNTHGWGAFALEAIRRGEFICEYIGAMISQEEAERRGSVYDKITMSFLFNLNEDAVIDAVRRGNKSKFINHGSVGQNCTAKVLHVGGEHHIAIFAKEDIMVGQELYFNYGYQGQSAPDWS
uniref:Polycomblike protein putative n=1 Tax=Albugo laibachii Nc14 TaxID=890382 RepID=F0WTA9_9STRA|nr:polycomblike protein putative [Albugo laibachii Nc14]|eukprot:CCA24598.1 polycomblike protein putative [Albugo laibachii Nc14]